MTDRTQAEIRGEIRACAARMKETRLARQATIAQLHEKALEKLWEEYRAAFCRDYWKGRGVEVERTGGSRE